MKYQVIEKLDLDFLSKITGLTKKAAEEAFMIGDIFKIEARQFKIIQKTKENENIVFICHVWN